MEAGNVALFLTLWIIPSFCDPADPVTITVEPGQNATLPCQHNISWNSLVLEWRRSDLLSDYVFMYKQKRIYAEHHHQSYKNRVSLKDRERKDGDVSLVLKNVTINDTGTYECRVDHGRNRTKRGSPLQTEPICIIHLHVAPPTNTATTAATTTGRGHIGLFLALLVFALMIVLIFALTNGSVWEEKMKNSCSSSSC